MSKHNLKRSIFGGVLDFLETGTTVSDGGGGTLTLSKTVKPAADAAEWGDSSLGCGIQFTLEKDEETDALTCFNRDTNSYDNNDETRIVADYIVAQLAEHSDIVDRLTDGIAALPANAATAVVPHSQDKREIYGWAKIEARDARSNNTHSVRICYVKIELDGTPEWSNETTKPTLRLKIIRTNLNEIKYPLIS